MTKQLTPLRRKDQATGYQAAVKDIVTWLRDEARGPYFADLIEAKFNKSNSS